MATARETAMKEKNRRAMNIARQKMAELSERAEKSLVTGGITIYIPLLEGQHTRVKATLDEITPVD